MSVVIPELDGARKLLRKHFRIRKNSAGTGKIFKGVGELLFDDVRKTLDFGPEDPECPREDEPYVDFEVAGCKWESILGFEYQSGGPMCFYHSLCGLDLGGDFVYMELRMDDIGEWFIAAIPKAGYDELLPEFLEDFYRSNGRNYWMDGVFGTLPSTTEVLSSAVDVNLMKECYRLFLDNQGDHYMGNSWKTEMEDCQATLKRPNPMDMALHALRELSENVKDGGETYFEAKDAASREFEENILNDAVKASILDLLLIAKTQFPKG